MSPTFPYTYISCPCSDPSRRIRAGRLGSTLEEDDLDDERTFDPQNPRSSYSLFPPEHLLYCEECHDIKCPRCIKDEIVCWYCPSCLFETPSSMVRSEGNRCARNCFNCPICTAALVVQGVGEGDTKDGPWILNCNYCMWTSLDVGIKFDKPTNIRSQMDKLTNGGISRSESGELARKSSLAREATPQNSSGESLASEAPSDPVARFAAMKGFYKNQLAASIGGDPLSPSSSLDNYASPSALTRIMSLYTSTGSGLRKPKSKPPLMREALTPSEGLQVGFIPSASPATPVLPSTDLSSIPTRSQLLSQHPPMFNGNPQARNVSSLRPVPTLLRTKRSKRCQTCKHILVKPEFKPQTTRFRIRLIALAYIPLISLRPLIPPPIVQHPLMMDPPELIPGKTAQFILSLKNHLFEPVKVSLGVPGVTPGKYAHKVTVLCPSFEIGANSDVWDDALGDTGRAPVSTGAFSIGTTGENTLGGMGSGTMEAGKVYERGRNWVGVGVEVVCAPLNKGENGDLEDEDEDVIEIPIRVRLEWRQTDGEDATGHDRKSKPSTSGRQRSPTEAAGGEDEDPLRRELAYWMVVGVGKVKRM